MTTLFAIFALWLAPLVALAAVAVGTPAPLRRRTLALALAVACLGVGYLGFAEATGRPKLVRLAWLEAGAEEAVVVASEAVEGEAIYLWLRLPESSEPRAYRLPWDRRLAEQLLEAGREAEASGTETRMRRPFQEASEPAEPTVYAAPPPPLPPKTEG